ncbi:MAG: DUF2247 family protein [Armatimonadota bacterium]
MTYSTDFITKNIPLTWSDVLWGYEKQLIGWRVPIEIANVRLKTDTSFDLLEFELAGVQKDQDWKVGQIIEELSRKEAIPKLVSKEKWLFLTLLWLYENQDSIEGSLRKVEEVYANFDYPEEIVAFVNFMGPSNGYDTTSHTLSENQNKMMENWKDYLDKTRARLSDI